MFERKREERTTPPNWGGTRKKSGRRKLAPSSSVRVDSELLREVRKFTRFNGTPRELIEAAIQKELLERQKIQAAHLKVVALEQIERWKRRGLPPSANMLEIAGLSSSTPKHKNAI
jgi:hypothetical protein